MRSVPRLLVLILILTAGCAVKSVAQVPLGYWSWMGGSDPNLPGDAPFGAYGTQYQFAPTNWPGKRYDPLHWTDHSGRMWLFGGQGYYQFSQGGLDLNDLWVFDPKRGTHGEWAWMGGCQVSPTTECAGNYGTEYEFADSNFPGARADGNAWVDADDHFWLFGGWGVDSSGSEGVLNDLWMFDPQRGAHGQWAWMGGSNAHSTCVSGDCGVAGNYTTLHQFDPANAPAGRFLASSWIDRDGKLWVFSGWGIVSVSGTLKRSWLPDLWVFDPKQGAHGEWAWMGGAAGMQMAGVYGTKYAYSDSNWPSPRWWPVVWMDDTNKFWLYGGLGFDSTGKKATLNDLWVFDPTQGTNGEWAWMGGPKVVTRATPLSFPVERPVYGTEYTFGPGNTPGGRQTSVGWKDNQGRLWLYGGYGVGYGDDLWAFDPARGMHGEWAWMGGHSSMDSWTPVVGTEYQFGALNNPGARTFGTSWVDGNGNLWLYGGVEEWPDPQDYEHLKDDLWIYRFRLPQTITFPKPAPSFTYGDAPVQLDATADSGLATTFHIVDGPASLSGTHNSVLTITGGGAPVRIRASQAGSLRYLPAPDMTQAFWVYKHELTVKADDKTMQFGEAVPPLTWTASGFVNGDTAATALSGVPATVTGAKSNWQPGNYLIRVATGTLNSANYNFSFVRGTLTVTPLGTAGTPRFSLASGTYSGAQTVSIMGTGCPCTFYYTTDGSTPSPTNGTKYSGAFAVSASETVNAIATKAGYTPSAMISATYTIQ